MTHNEIQERLDEYADGELSSADAASVADHVRACADCAAGLERVRKLSALFQPAPLPPTDFFVSRVMSRVRATSTPRAGFFGAWRWAALGLGVATLILFSTLPSEESASLSTREILLADRSSANVAVVSTSVEPDGWIDAAWEEI